MDEIDRQIEIFQKKPQFDPMSVVPKLTDEEKERYTTKDGTLNFLAYEKDKGKLSVISDKGEKDLNRSFKRFMVGFLIFIVAVVSAFGVGAIVL